MNSRDILFTKVALSVLESAGIHGLSLELWMEHISAIVQSHLTTVEQTALVERIERNEWVLSYRDPVRDQVRYVLSGIGKLALGTLTIETPSPAFLGEKTHHVEEKLDTAISYLERISVALEKLAGK